MTDRRRFARGVIAVGLAMALGAAGASVAPAGAQPLPAPQPPDPAYPFTEILQVLTGPMQEAMTPGMLDYFVRAGILTNLGKLTKPFEDLTKPETYNAPDAQRRQLEAAQKIWDAITHVAPFGAGFPPHPYYTPDWNNNGRFGIADLDDAMVDDDYDDPAVQEGKFRYPCLTPSATVLYETADGGCAAGDSAATFKLGTVRKFRVVNSRGIRLSGKVYFPEGAEEATEKYPVTIGMPGASESQNDVAMYAQSSVRNGFVAFTFAQAGQPGSEGNALDLISPLFSVEHCFAPGSCRDAQDVVRWVAGEDVLPVFDLANEVATVLQLGNPRLVRANPLYAPVGANMRNPWLDRLDLAHLNLWGQSVGSIGMTSYLNWQAKGHGIDGRPLPRVSSVVGMSGFTQVPASAPLQVQTADFDIPGIWATGFWPTENPIIDATDGPIGTKELYDKIRRDPRSTSPAQFITYEGGSHGDSINWLGVPRNAKTANLSVYYAMNWFKCYGRADADQGACDALARPMDGLSRAVPTEYSPDGPGGPSLCVTIPDRATLEQAILRPQIFIQNNWGPAFYDCTPQG
ncbi:hypothetical protein [Nocardia sp. NPDC052566]|uniref:hypothetical protein n=1 Tax=Nocardia sp. NPDC052566 TaxID=3364330 RepID=UPI0037CA92B6